MSSSLYTDLRLAHQAQQLDHLNKQLNSSSFTSSASNSSSQNFRYTSVTNIQPPSSIPDVTYTEGTSYDALSFGRATSFPVVRNSVLFVPHLITPEECAVLVKDCERRVVHQDSSSSSWLFGSEAATHAGIPFERHEVKNLSEKTQLFVQQVLRKRLLPFVSDQMPSMVEANVWKVSNVQKHSNEILALQEFKYSEQEPAINRYTNGGVFPPHRDALALTVNVLLSDSFDGGGTEFWEERNGGSSEEAKEPTLTVLPKVGVGVVFNGTVKHAGRAVTGGVRHLLVASFSVVPSSSCDDVADDVNVNVTCNRVTTETKSCCYSPPPIAPNALSVNLQVCKCRWRMRQNRSKSTHGNKEFN